MNCSEAKLLFSPEDADLAGLRWWFDRHGYARTSGKPPARVRPAHRIVGERIVGRPLTPADVVDHINFNLLDNRRENLRVVTMTQNSQHRRPHGSSGYRGVTFHKQVRRWQAAVGHRGKHYYCGMFDTPEEAAAAAEAKRTELGFLSGA